MAKKVNMGESETYLFPGEGGKRDQLEQAILTECETQQFPLPRRIQTVKAGGLIFKSKEQCILIDGGKEFEILISNVSVGTFLYVEVYYCPKTGFMAGLAAATSNVFKEQKNKAVYAAAQDIVERAFAKLGLKQQHSAYEKKAKNGSSALAGLLGGAK